MRARDRQNEVVVAVIVISALALALTFGLVLSLGSRSNNNSDEDATNTSESVLVRDDLTLTISTDTPDEGDETVESTETDVETPTATVIERTESDDATETSEPEVTDTEEPTATSEPTETDEPSVTPSPKPSETSTTEPTEEDIAPSPEPTETATIEPESLETEDANGTVGASPTSTSRVTVHTLTPTMQLPTETVTPQDEPTKLIATATSRSSVDLSTIIVTLTPTVELTTQTPTATSRSSVDIATEIVTLTPTSTVMQPTTRPNVEFSTQVVTLTLAQTATPVPSLTPTIEIPTVDDTIVPTFTITPFEALVVTATPNNCEPPKDWVPYVVQLGDTLFLIASQAGLQTDTLRQANCIVGDRILAGQTLYVPPGITVMTTPIVTQSSSVSGTCPNPGIQITYPYPGDVLTDSLIVRGIATGEFFGHYQLQLRPENSIIYQPIFISDQRTLFESQLGPITLSSSFVPGNYFLRLEVFNRWGNAIGQCDIPVQIR